MNVRVVIEVIQDIRHPRNIIKTRTTGNLSAYQADKFYKELEDLLNRLEKERFGDGREDN